MMPIPSRRLIQAASALLLASLVVLVFPRTWPVLIALDLALVLFALLDWIITPARSMQQIGTATVGWIW